MIPSARRFFAANWSTGPSTIGTSIRCLAPVAQVCAFALGCAVIHAARTRSVAVLRVLAALAIVTAALVLLGDSFAHAPDGELSLKGTIVYDDA